MKKRFLILIIVILAIFSIFIGVHEISVRDVIDGNQEKISVLFISRFPRLLSLILAGVGLSISGAIMQHISNNKFVSPTTAATMDSAKLGVLVSMIIFSTVTLWEKMIIGFVFALLGTYIFMIIMKKVKFKNVEFIPLIGIMLGGVIGAITDFFAYRFNLMQNLSSFMQGSFSGILRGNYEILYLTIPLIVIALIYANKFTIIGMGEDISKNLGVNFEKVANIGLVIISLITVFIFITVGNIPFVGLIIPNIVSIFMGDNLNRSIWNISLLGVIFVLFCDIVSRLIIFPYEVPISLTVGGIGSITFLYLIYRGRRYG
ncbi:MAG: ABC transporter permease [Sarcina sp.]